MLEVNFSARAGSFVLQIDFALPSDGVVAVFGNSGAGKSSLLNALAGLLKPESGRIALNDTVFFSSEERINLPIEQRGIGYVFQEGRLFPHMSVAQNLDYGAKRRTTRAKHSGLVLARDDVISLLALEGLMQRRTPLLSGGERQRVAIGRALLAAPRVLLLDEPLAALDQPRKLEIMQYVQALRQATRLPIVLVSHSVGEVVRLADSMVVVEHGQVSVAGTLSEVLASQQLAGVIDPLELSSVIEGNVESVTESGLTKLAFAGGSLTLRSTLARVGDHIRVRIRASDVAVSLEPLAQTSISNVLTARIVEIDVAHGDARLVLDLQGATLIASITLESVARLELTPGRAVFALIKSVALTESAVAA